MTGASVVDNNRFAKTTIPVPNEFIGDGFKSLLNTVADDEDMVEYTVDFGVSNSVVSVFLMNPCQTDNWQFRIHVSHFRIGDDPTEFSMSNVIVKDNVVSGGFFELSPITAGRYLTIRKDEPYSDQLTNQTLANRRKLALN